MDEFRESLVEAHTVMREHMQEFVQMQFSVELNMQVQHEQTAGPVFIWEPSVDLMLQTQDSVITSIEHLNDDAKKFLVGFFSSVSNSIIAAGVHKPDTIAPWKGIEVEGTIFNGQYGWEGSEFIDYEITTRPVSRTIVGIISLKDEDIVTENVINRACTLCDYVLVFVHKPTKDVSDVIVSLKKEKYGEKLIIRGILSKSSKETYLYPLCRTDTLVVPLSPDTFWSDESLSELGAILRRMDVTGYRGIDIQDSILDVLEMKSHPPNAIGVTDSLKVTYMGNVLKWGNNTSVAELSKNTCVYREGVTDFAKVGVSRPGMMRMPYINLSSTSNYTSKPDPDFMEKVENSKKYSIDAAGFMPRKIVARLLRGSARWSVYNT